MKRRVRKIANFFAFNLLFFALYLNFIHKDKLGVPGDQTTQVKPAAFSETTQTVLVENPEQYLKKKNQPSTPTAEEQAAITSAKTETVTPLRLSIN